MYSTLKVLQGGPDNVSIDDPIPAHNPVIYTSMNSGNLAQLGTLSFSPRDCDKYGRYYYNLNYFPDISMPGHKITIETLVFKVRQR